MQEKTETPDRKGADRQVDNWRGGWWIVNALTLVTGFCIYMFIRLMPQAPDWNEAMLPNSDEFERLGQWGLWVVVGGPILAVLATLWVGVSGRSYWDSVAWRLFPKSRMAALQARAQSDPAISAKRDAPNLGLY